MGISLELKLTADCCRWAFGHGREPDIPAAIDWPRFLRTARFHRVQGLVWNALRSSGDDLPAEIARALPADAQEIAATNLRIAAEARELRAAFDETGLRILFVKGLTVGALAYSRPMLKMGWDVDVLVEEAAVTAAAAELAARGYRRTVPAPAIDLASWHARRKESVWSRPEERLYVELHTRLADNRRLIPDIGIDSPHREVEVADGIALPTLAPDELFAYLSVHGASSAWFRLKWISDFAGLIAGLPPCEIERLHARSQELGAGRAAGQALLLADRLFETLGESPLKTELMADAAVRRLADAAFRQLAGRAEPLEPTAIRLGTWRIHWTQLLLMSGSSFKFGEAARQLRDAMA